MERLMLLELVNTDPVHPYPAEAFPFLAGAMRRAEIPLRWLRYGIDSHPGDTSPAFATEMVQEVVREASVFGATHVLCNVSAAALEGAVGTVGSLSWRTVDTSTALGSERAFARIFDWLGRSGQYGRLWKDDQDVIEGVQPEYQAEARNEAARNARIVTELYCGATCHYRRSVRSNPHFEGIILPRGTADRGCSFCAAGSDPMRTRTPVEDLILRQIVAARKAWRPDQRPEFVLGSSEAFRRLPAVVDGILQARLPPSALLFSCRIDELLRQVAQLERALPPLKEAGHLLGIQRLGVENLSAVENERFNKGIATAQVLQVDRELDRLERAYPETFAFAAYGGFGFITYTPWTTFEDLRANIDVARQLRYIDEDYFTRSRLQLRPGLAITELARREGLLIETPEDHSFFSGCIRFADDYELPWRFRDPRVGVVFSIARRVGKAEDIVADDPLLAQVRQFLLHLPLESLGCIDVLEALANAASEGPDPVSADALMERTLQQAQARALQQPEPRPGPVSGVGLLRMLSTVVARQPSLLFGFRPAAVTVRSPALVLRLEREGRAADVQLEPRADRRCRASSLRYDLTLLGTSTAESSRAGAMVERCAALLDRIPPLKSG